MQHSNQSSGHSTIISSHYIQQAEQQLVMRDSVSSESLFTLLHCSLSVVTVVVQWSAFRYDNLGFWVRSPDIRWPLFILWYYRRVAKDYPNCCHTVLRRDLQCLYASEALAAIASCVLNIFKRERKHLRCHYINLKTYAK